MQKHIYTITDMANKIAISITQQTIRTLTRVTHVCDARLIAYVRKLTDWLR